MSTEDRSSDPAHVTGPFAQSISDALAKPPMFPMHTMTWILPDDDGFKVRVEGVSTQTALDRLVERGFDACVCDDLVLVRLPSPASPTQ